MWIDYVRNELWENFASGGVLINSVKNTLSNEQFRQNHVGFICTPTRPLAYKA